MSKLLKNILIIVGISLIIGIFFIASLYFKHKEYENKVRKIAHIDIYQTESIVNLKMIEFKICDSIYLFNYNEIKDTICENLAISDKEFPCKVKMKYIFNNGTTKQMNIEEFNCAGCSGTNTYKLFNGKVEYEYHP